LEIWNAELNSIEKKNRGTSSIQLKILILQLTVHNGPHVLVLFTEALSLLPIRP
jgi:hypothetical protein